MNSSLFFGLLIMGIGLLIAVIASIMVLVNAWRQSIGWFLLAFFVPFGRLIFVCMHWSETKGPFLMTYVGVAIMFAGIFAVPDVREHAMKDIRTRMGVKETPARNYTAEIQEHRDQLELLQASFAQDGVELTKQYQQLDAQRKALKPGDTEATLKFNEAAAAYQARNTARKQMQQRMDTTQKELDELLEARSRSAARNASSNNSNNKKVVMYTTSRCPACKAAKQYFAQKGVSYDEIDVETSRSGYEEFRRLGGQGVPLIMVGDKKLEGFNAMALDAML
jgi:glutaredoxin